MTEHSYPSGVPVAAEDDVVALLMRQHDEIRELFGAVESSLGAVRREAFHRLLRLLVVHETAEEEVVHPYARHALEGGDAVVERRLEEERHAKELLDQLEGMDPDDPAFMTRFQRLRRDVETHADAEERHEFAFLRAMSDPDRRWAMAKAVQAAEAVAPTRPHPGVESATMNVTVGTLAAVADRTRDAIRGAAR